MHLFQNNLVYNDSALKLNLKRMKKQVQQARKEKYRGSQKFQFSSQNIGKRTGKLLKVYDEDNNYLRWSDTTQVDDELIIAKEESSQSFSIIQRENQVNDTRSQKSKSSHRSKSLRKNEASNKVKLKGEASLEQAKKEKKEIVTQLSREQQAESKKLPKETDSQQKLKQNLLMLERQKQQFYRLKKQEERNKAKTLQIQKQIVKNNNTKVIKNQDPSPIIYQQQKVQKQQRMVKNNENERKNKKQVQSKKFDNKRQVKREQAQKEVPVVKNHKTAKAYKTDYGTIQFQYVLPQQLRNLGHQEVQYVQINQQEATDDNLKRERPQESKNQDKEQEQKQNNKRNKFQKQKEKENSRKNIIQEMKKDQESKKPTFRVSQQETPGLQQLRAQKQTQVKGFASNVDQIKRQKVSKKQKEVKATKVIENVSIIQNSRLKKRKIVVDQTEAQQIIGKEYIVQVNSQVSSEVSRPRRTRTKPVRFYENQKVAYNLKNQIILTGISTQKFMQALGFESAQQITGNSIEYASNSVRHRVCLKKQQTICSYGLDEEKFSLYLKPLVNFQKIWVSYYLNPSKDLKIKIDHSSARTLDEEIQFEKDQTVQITNQSDRKSHYIIIAIQRRNKNNK